MLDPSSVLADAKNIWRKSVRRKDGPILASAIDPDGYTPVTLAVVGCGQRGNVYSEYAIKHPERCKVVAVAEPRNNTRKAFSERHNVDNTLIFKTWQDLYKASTETIDTVGKRLADAVIVAIQDQLHAEVTVAFAEQGYAILCEKPQATTVEDCIQIAKVIKKTGVIFGMGHVMRYSPYTKEITEIVRSAKLGRLINLVQVEPIGYWHFAHSYVRGNWGNEGRSSFSLMTKSCHDIDIVCHWMSPSKPSRISSFGSLQHFRKQAKPKEAGNATRCLDCRIANECPYSAKRVYLDAVSSAEKHWPVDVLVEDVPDIENITAALQEGPYGKCVYETDNDVCDNQVVNIEFDNGSTASFTMVAFTSLVCSRQLRMHFTHGEIVGDMSKYTVTDFSTRSTKTYYPRNDGGGHGGGDLGLIASFVEAVRTGRQEALETDVDEVLNSHLTVFAAEMSRKEHRVVDFLNFQRQAWMSGEANPV